MADQQSQLFSLVSTYSPFPDGWRPTSDLRQCDLVGVRVAVNVEDEGVFVGVMLNDVIVHVHQDPEKGDASRLASRAEQVGAKLKPASSLTLFYSSCTLWLSSLWARRTSPISTHDKWKQLINKCSAANRFCHRLSEQPLTASIRPLSVGDFSIRASNTSSVSFLTYSSTAETEQAG